MVTLHFNRTRMEQILAEDVGKLEEAIREDGRYGTADTTYNIQRLKGHVNESKRELAQLDALDAYLAEWHKEAHKG